MDDRTARAPGRPERRTVLIVAGVTAAVVVVCVLGVVAGNLVSGGREEPSPTTAVSSPAAVGPEEEPTPVVLEMPDVVGQNAAVARDELERLGFTDVEFGSADEGDSLVIIAANWTVVEQSHEPGARLAADAVIVLTCSKKK
ncbi:PASTA domain-containing protein [Phytomonospora sp. NPDC050363]|uniref:PASTA domain-containing protein n=1 Tax=Phytomonospora sp. NPDC050363 TaxID=3155642 RepID=UPI0033FF9E31